MDYVVEIYGPLTQAERCLDTWLREENRILPKPLRTRAAALLARYFQNEDVVSDQLMLSFLRHYSGLGDVDLDDIQSVKTQLKSVLDKSVVDHSDMPQGRRQKMVWGFALVPIIACFFLAWIFFQSPITPAQQETLRAAVRTAAEQRQVAHATIWADVKKAVNVTRYQDITRVQFARALSATKL